MMNFATPARELLQTLRRHGIRLQARDGHLHVVAPDRSFIEAFPGLPDVLKGRKVELLACLASEQSRPIDGYDYVPLRGEVTPWPSVPFMVPAPCVRCHRVAWPDDGAERLADGTVVCGYCVKPSDVEAGSIPMGGADA